MRVTLLVCVAPAVLHAWQPMLHRARPAVLSSHVATGALLMTDNDETDLMTAFREKLKAESDGASLQAAPQPEPQQPEPLQPDPQEAEPEQPDYFSNPFATPPPDSKKKNAVDVENEKRASFLKQQKELDQRRSKGEFDVELCAAFVLCPPHAPHSFFAVLTLCDACRQQRSVLPLLRRRWDRQGTGRRDPAGSVRHRYHSTERAGVSHPGLAIRMRCAVRLAIPRQTLASTMSADTANLAQEA
eukprot:958377-Prymnesium_polylepis.1